jgi:hypothetical protein
LWCRPMDALIAILPPAGEAFAVGLESKEVTLITTQPLADKKGMEGYLYYSAPEDNPASVRVLNTSTKKWCGTILQQRDGKWQSTRGNVFENQDDAAADSDMGEQKRNA